MGLRAFDKAFVEEAIAEFEALTPDLSPEWGSMRPPQMIAHLTTAVRYGLNKEEHTPPEGNFLIRHVLSPILLSGLLRMPKNIAKPKLYDASAPEGTLDALRTEIEDQLTRQDEGSFDPPPHPALGDLGPNGWGNLHTIHIEHHLRQFGRKLRIKD